MALITRIKSAIWRRIDPSDKARIKRILKDPPAVSRNSIVFVSSDDYSGNPKALFLHMIEHDYNKKYKITWIFEKRDNYFEFDIPNVKSVCMWAVEGENEQRSFESYKAVLSARYIFYSHNVNWAKVFRPEQTFIDLWHGCGYKGDLSSDRRRIYYDYLMVTGKKYMDIFRNVLKNPDGNILDLGYPRNECLFTRRSDANRLLAELKELAGSTRASAFSSSDANRPVSATDNETEKSDPLKYGSDMPVDTQLSEAETANAKIVTSNQKKSEAQCVTSKTVIWMPTYRKSKVARLDTDTGLGETGLPIMYDADALHRLDAECRVAGVLMIIKQHLLQADYDVRQENFTNIVFIDDGYLRSRNADLYELMGQTDALLTDYSSVAIDYMLTDKPIGYTLDDFDLYEEARGWSFDNVKEFMPGHHIYTESDLYDFIRDIASGSDRYREQRKNILDKVHTYRDGFSERILQYFGI